MLGGLVEAPVKAVQIQVHKAAPACAPAHRPKRVLHPDIAQVAGVLRSITQPAECFSRLTAGVEGVVSIAPGPAIHEATGAQHDSIVCVHSPAEPVILQLGGSVVAAEANSDRMFGRADVITAGIAMDLNSSRGRKFGVAIAAANQFQRRRSFPGRPNARWVWINAGG